MGGFGQEIAWWWVSYAGVLVVFVAGGFAGLLVGLGCCGFGVVCGFAVWF